MIRMKFVIPFFISIRRFSAPFILVTFSFFYSIFATFMITRFRTSSSFSVFWTTFFTPCFFRLFFIVIFWFFPIFFRLIVGFWILLTLFFWSATVSKKEFKGFLKKCLWKRSFFYFCLWDPPFSRFLSFDFFLSGVVDDRLTR